MTLFEREHYTVEIAAGSDVVVMHGVLRLASPAAYEPVFAPVRAQMAAKRAATVDISDVTFMNSSGIRALASIVLLANADGVTLGIVAREAIPWQRKTIASFRAISPALQIDLR
jgi:hypothetical protein